MLHRTRIFLAAAGFISAAMIATANAAEIQLLGSTAMREALDELLPHFEKETGHKVVRNLYPAATLVLKVKEGAPADIVMTTPDNLAALMASKHLVEGTRVDFVHSRVGVAVKAGAPKPDIGTAEALKAAFLAAKSIGISRGPSGVHLLNAMAKIGIADQVKAKMVQPDLGVRVGTLVADGKAEIGVQQIGELLPIPGIVYIDPLPGELQTVIVYGMGRSANAKQWGAASTAGEVSHLARGRTDAEEDRA
jgi:molybdate transport system substrate-binding protein